jgi:hypothetical protein
MCTNISSVAAVRGAAKGAKAGEVGPSGWFPLTQMTVGWDHPSALATRSGHAVLIDFSNFDLGISARVGVEMDLESARLLCERLAAVVAAAEAAEAV